MPEHRAPRNLAVHPGRAATPIATLALSAAALTAVAPMAWAHPRDTSPSGNGSIGVLDDLTLLPVETCGLQLPILGSILDAPDADCTRTDG